MKKFLKSEFVMLKNNKGMLISSLIYVVFVLYLYFIILTEDNINSVYKIFSTVTIFLLVIKNTITLGGIIEQKIIRYYLEYFRRKNFLNYIYIEYIGLYIMLNFIFYSLIFLKYRIINIQYMIIYLIIFLLYFVISINIILVTEKNGISLLITILGLWLVPNLVNYLLNEILIYKLQLFYYLSPDSFNILEKINGIAIMYIILFYIISIKIFLKKEY